MATIPPYLSDFLDNYELGFKSRWLDDRGYAELIGICQALPGANTVNAAVMIVDRPEVRTAHDFVEAMRGASSSGSQRASATSWRCAAGMFPIRPRR